MQDIRASPKCGRRCDAAVPVLDRNAETLDTVDIADISNTHSHSEEQDIKKVKHKEQL
jgi:hypothetical protein